MTTVVGHGIGLKSSPWNSNVPGDDNPLDFGSPFPDVEEFLVPIMAFDGIFLHQTVSTVELDRLVCYAMIHFGAEHLRHSGFLREGTMLLA